jgi:rubrerythrin
MERERNETRDRPLRHALEEVLDDEYRARATYRAVLDRHGPVRPFSAIVEAEDRHVRALLPLFRRHGFPVPEDPWRDRVEAPATLREACAAAVAAELENAAMFDRLAPVAADHPDVAAVFERLREASAERHLPAFRRCLAREGDTEPRGCGAGPRRRRRRGGHEEEDLR